VWVILFLFFGFGEWFYNSVACKFIIQVLWLFLLFVVCIAFALDLFCLECVCLRLFCVLALLWLCLVGLLSDFICLVAFG